MKLIEPKIKIIARIHTDFPDKFGIPRQSGLVEELQGVIVFEPEYRNPDAPFAKNGSRWCARLALAETRQWAFLRRVPPSDPTP